MRIVLTYTAVCRSRNRWNPYAERTNWFSFSANASRITSLQWDIEKHCTITLVKYEIEIRSPPRQDHHTLFINLLNNQLSVRTQRLLRNKIAPPKQERSSEIETLLRNRDTPPKQHCVVPCGSDISRAMRWIKIVFGMKSDECENWICYRKIGLRLWNRKIFDIEIVATGTIVSIWKARQNNTRLINHSRSYMNQRRMTRVHGRGRHHRTGQII